MGRTVKLADDKCNERHQLSCSSVRSALRLCQYFSPVLPYFKLQLSGSFLSCCFSPCLYPFRSFFPKTLFESIPGALFMTCLPKSRVYFTSGQGNINPQSGIRFSLFRILVRSPAAFSFLSVSNHRSLPPLRAFSPNLISMTSPFATSAEAFDLSVHCHAPDVPQADSKSCVFLSDASQQMLSNPRSISSAGHKRDSAGPRSLYLLELPQPLMASLSAFPGLNFQTLGIISIRVPSADFFLRECALLETSRRWNPTSWTLPSFTSSFVTTSTKP